MRDRYVGKNYKTAVQFIRIRIPARRHVPVAPFFPPRVQERNESGGRSTAALWRPRSAMKGTGRGRRAAATTAAAAATRKLQAYQVMTLPPTQT